MATPRVFLSWNTHPASHASPSRRRVGCDNTTPNSNDTTNTKNFVPKLTDEFIACRKTDCLLRGWIIGTLSEEALGLVVGLDTAHPIWTTLKYLYAEDSQERGFTLRQ